LSQSNLIDERFLSLARKVTYAVDPLATDRSRWSGEVVLLFKNGVTVRHRVSDLLGTPNHPMSESQLIEKFIHNAEGVLPELVSQHFIEQVVHLEKVTDINTVFEPLCQGWKK
jgi:2-methylcitrate dehydratase PrpD